MHTLTARTLRTYTGDIQGADGIFHQPEEAQVDIMQHNTPDIIHQKREQPRQTKHTLGKRERSRPRKSSRPRKRSGKRRRRRNGRRKRQM